MKFPHYIVLSLGFVITAASAQPTPQHPADAAREQRAAQREYQREHGPYLRDQRGYDAIESRHQRWQYCREWRARVERHPRLILPRECRR